MAKSKSIVKVGKIQQRILLIRGEKVIVDADLAEFYGVPTKVLNQAVRRNIERFPADFMFQLNKDEKLEVVTNCDHLNKLKYSPVNCDTADTGSDQANRLITRRKPLKRALYEGLEGTF